jgi:hypothetical protein
MESARVLELGLPLTCLLSLLLLPWIAAAVRRRLDVLSPVLIFTMCIFIGYVIPIPTFLAETDPVTAYWTNVYGNFERSLEQALWVTILGVLGFYLGYFVTRDLALAVHAQDANSRPRHWRDGRLRLVSLVYTLLGLSLFSIGVVIIGGPGALISGLWSRIFLFAGLNYFFSAINLLLVISLIWWVRGLSIERLPGVAFWSYTVVAVALAALQGSKSILFVFAVAMIVAYHTLRQRVSPARLVALGAVLLVVGSAYVIYVREFIPLGELHTLDTSESWPVLLWVLVAREFAGNFVQLQALTLIVDLVPSVMSFQNGQTLLAMLTVAIPSAFFPDKYPTAPGVFTMAIDPDRVVREGTTLPPGLIGELYMNFGFSGVLFGLMCFGAVFGWIRGVQRRRGRDPRTVILYALVVAMMAHYVRGELVSPTVLLLIFLLPAAMALRYVLERPVYRARGDAAS